MTAHPKLLSGHLPPIISLIWMDVHLGILGKRIRIEDQYFQEYTSKDLCYYGSVSFGHPIKFR